MNLNHMCVGGPLSGQRREIGSRYLVAPVLPRLPMAYVNDTQPQLETTIERVQYIKRSICLGYPNDQVYTIWVPEAQSLDETWRLIEEMTRAEHPANWVLEDVQETVAKMSNQERADFLEIERPDPVWQPKEGPPLPVSRMTTYHIMFTIAKIQRSPTGWRSEYIDPLLLELMERVIRNRHVDISWGHTTMRNNYFTNLETT